MAPLFSSLTLFSLSHLYFLPQISYDYIECFYATMKILKQTSALLFSFGFVYLWQTTFLGQYTIPTIGLLILLFFLLTVKKGLNIETMLASESVWGIVVLNTIILILVFSTGIMQSPLFFLLYFLTFGVAFVFDPITVFVFLLGLVLLFLPETLSGDVTGNVLRIGSLVLISPLAFLFGRTIKEQDTQDQQVEMMQERAQDAADTIAENVDELLKEEKKTEEVAKLNEILEETEVLREESKAAK